MYHHMPELGGIDGVEGRVGVGGGGQGQPYGCLLQTSYKLQMAAPAEKLTFSATPLTPLPLRHPRTS